MSKKSILVIEDDMPLCWLLERILAKKFKVNIKHDSIEAMYWLTDGHIPDLIISDFNMPNFNGMDFLKFLKRSGVFNTIPVIMLSGLADEKVKEECKSFGVTHFVEKPFDPKKLETLVEDVLKNLDDYAKIR